MKLTVSQLCIIYKDCELTSCLLTSHLFILKTYHTKTDK